MSSLIDIDDNDVQDLIEQLQTYARKALPFAVRNGIKGSAFAAQDEWRSQMRRKLTLRNKHTTRSVRVDTRGARGFNIDTMEAVTGSDAEYIERTELGGTIKASGKFGVPIPTPDARISKSVKRVVSRPNLQKNIKLGSRSRTGGKRARNRKAIHEALKGGRKFAFLELTNGRSGIFSVSGGGESLKVRMVWDMSRTRKVVRTPSTPTLRPAMRVIGPAIPAIYAQAILEQLRRNTLFGF